MIKRRWNKKRPRRSCNNYEANSFALAPNEKEKTILIAPWPDGRTIKLSKDKAIVLAEIIMNQVLSW